MIADVKVREQNLKVLKRHRADPVAFVKEALGVEPTEQQKQLLQAVGKPGAHVAVRSGHGTGKSCALAWLLLWFLCTHEDARVPSTAPTSHQLEDILWPEVEKWHGKLHPFYKESLEVKNDKVELQGAPSFAVRRTARKESPEALQGFHAKNMLFLIDEASGIPEQIFEVAEGALSTPGARVVMTANPTRTTGYFFNAFHRGRDRWERLRFSCLDSPLVSPGYVEKMQSEYGEESDVYRVRVLGEFPRGGDLQFIPASAVEDAMNRSYREESFSFAPRLLGVDVAWFGGDQSVVFLRQGLYSKVLWRGRNVELAVFAGVVARLEDEQRAEAVFVDATGVGAGVVSNLREMGRSPVAVYLGGGSSRPEYLNKRAECWGLMREWIAHDGGWIPEDERLRDDLCAPEYGYDLKGRLRLERKEDMRKRGLASPDLADALALTFAAPVVRDTHEPDYRDEALRDGLFEWGK